MRFVIMPEQDQIALRNTAGIAAGRHLKQIIVPGIEHGQLDPHIGDADRSDQIVTVQRKLRHFSRRQFFHHRGVVLEHDLLISDLPLEIRKQYLRALPRLHILLYVLHPHAAR